MIDVIGVEISRAVAMLEKEGFVVEVNTYDTDKQKFFDCAIVIRQTIDGNKVKLTTSNFLLEVNQN